VVSVGEDSRPEMSRRGFGSLDGGAALRKEEDWVLVEDEEGLGGGGRSVSGSGSGLDSWDACRLPL
jgi:hypothetical protein